MFKYIEIKIPKNRLSSGDSKRYLENNFDMCVKSKKYTVNGTLKFVNFPKQLLYLCNTGRSLF